MIFVIVFIIVFAFSCVDSDRNSEDFREEIFTDDDESGSGLCEEKTVSISQPRLPEKPVTKVPKAYGKKSDCIPLPDSENGRLILDEGCFLGCIRVEHELHISGKDPESTLIICNDEENQAVIEVENNAELTLENISLSGKTRCLTGGNGSRTNVKNSNFSHCTKGGINICPDEAGCRAELSVANSFIGDIDEADSGISYGISFGNGSLNISGSEISGVNSFGIAVWGESGEKNKILIENSIISGVYGGLRSYEGHGVYAENAADITIRQSSVSDTATSFVFVSGENGEINLQLVDFTAENMLKTGEEQGGVVLDGVISASFERVSIGESRGNGIFSRGATLYAEDLSIKSVFSDGLGGNGFGLQLVDGSKSSIKNLSVVSAEKAGVILDGKCSADIESFEILSTKSDAYSKEFGVGAALQSGAELLMKNGVFSENRESGILVLNSELSLENVEIRETKPRECSEHKSCVFAPGTDFAHGISLYSSSVLRFNSITLSGNNNGLNIESSDVFGFGGKEISFNRNTTAVNAWNINNFNELNENLSNSRYCGNGSVFTADLQPVREEF
ncbi:right-handed parallel beta-helix repeat-containing protein [bacterium]|nr:right-handed parallel beta-helix repeat-containing protein [bacterium]